MWTFLLKLAPGWLLNFLGGRLGLYLGIAGVTAVLVLVIYMRIFYAGKAAARTEALNATLQRLRAKLAAKHRQLEVGNDRPGGDELGGLLDAGKFGRRRN